MVEEVCGSLVLTVKVLFTPSSCVVKRKERVRQEMRKDQATNEDTEPGQDQGHKQDRDVMRSTLKLTGHEHDNTRCHERYVASLQYTVQYSSQCQSQDCCSSII